MCSPLDPGPGGLPWFVWIEQQERRRPSRPRGCGGFLVFVLVVLAAALFAVVRAV
jgi:hypothetical protein